ncbi:hypothetical protein E3U23_13250 [Erythrobacter litoralis]|nr:hypothetical protein [Erythrobacter litoralis]
MIDKSAFAKALAHRAFGSDAWLTFYLEGPSDRHEAMRDGLLALDARNLEGSESGFVYAKLSVALDQDAIEERINAVADLASKAGVEIGIIDLDSEFDVEISKFFTLWISSVC